MRYVCEKCGSKFEEPKEMITMVSEVKSTETYVCPICNSIDFHKDREYQQQKNDLEALANQCENIKELLTDIQIKCGNKLASLETITFSDLIDDMQKIKNHVQSCIENLEEY